MKSTDKMAESAIFLCMQCDEKHGWVMGGKKKVPHMIWGTFLYNSQFLTSSYLTTTIFLAGWRPTLII